MEGVPEAPLEPTPNGLVPEGEGWFVLNAQGARWWHREGRGAYCGFERGEPYWAELGFALYVLAPGEPMSMYHRENAQEDFLLLSGECLLIVEEEERPLNAWDFAHCPAGTNHTIVGAGDGLSVVVGVGARPEEDEIVYPLSEAALAHDAGVQVETTEPVEAYARFKKREEGPYRGGLI